ncbi:unnamed protein product [Clonostachys chloroleuca]|uniref:ATP-dependent helicase n=1 Tax=Clonostachys chloroleuca TaxID=1926264 RepID=A0AA35MJ38_9HYPO|nr:unnamed protein product [Clonostachys chloroleuca]
MGNHDFSNNKPGAKFAYKPTNTLSSSQKPDFSKSPRRVERTIARAPGDHDTNTPYFCGSAESIPKTFALQVLRPAMVNERAPPKASAPLRTMSSSQDNIRRDQTPDDDDDFDVISAMKGLSSVKSSVLQSLQDPAHPSGSTDRPRFGHPQMLSSRQQKASSVFIHQKTRPEHHLDARKIQQPQAPKYKDRKAPPLAVFESNVFAAPASSSARTGSNEIFYTDPNKASADLKDLLEGVMDDEEEDSSDEAKDEKPKKEEVKEEADNKRPGIVDPKTGTVPGLKVKLLPHQVEGVEWMRGRELGPVKRGKVPKGGILADDMGLGKTLQTITLILNNQKPKPEDKAWKKHYEAINKTTLVVAPLALIRQWEAEINEKIAKQHQLKVCVHHGPNRTKSFKELASYDIVVTTYQILVSEHGNSSPADDGPKTGCFGLHWWRVVLDEAHTIKNRNAKATKACYALRSEYRWCLSGTPMQNNLDELQSLVKFLRIKPYDDLKEWKAQIDHPLKNGKGHIAIRRLHSLLRCFMKRRTKEILKEKGALNPGGEPSKEGEASSTGFKVTERKVVSVKTDLSAAERRFYNKLEARADRSIEAMMGGKVNYASALTLLLRMRQACNHPKLIAGKLDSDALSADMSQKPSQDADVDAMADMFAGMGLASRSCNVCGLQLGYDDNKSGRETCSACQEDLALFQSEVSTTHVKPKKEKRNKTKSKSKEKNEEEEADSPIKKTSRRPRNRNAIVDSDDEDEEEAGSWLVPEDERGSVNLGKAGGEEDENAEGGGDWIGSDDSEEEEDDTDKDKSNLSSFVVDDETARKEKGYTSTAEESDDDSLLSISALTKQMASQTLEDKPVPKAKSKANAISETDETEKEDSDSEESDSQDSDSEASSEDDDGDDWDIRRGARGVDVVASAKIRELIKILQNEAKEHKFIVFSQFTSMLDLVEPFLYNEGLVFTRYDGSMKNDQREESLSRLRKDAKTRILLCSLKCGSLGLNLTAATRVVIIEPFWNPFIEEQAIDRVHRLTQTVDVIVYKITAKDTIEERIVDLQEKKRLLAEQAIEGGMKKGAFKLGLNEIIELFKPGTHAEEHAYVPGSTGDVRQAARDAVSVMRKKPTGLQRQESEVYGRRW